jgi:hypothetical protein
MEAPTTVLLSEIFSQHLKHNYIIHILQGYHIIRYYRYVDNILIIYNKQTTQIQNTLEELNSIHNTLKFIMEPEKRKIFLDITLINQGKIEFDIYRKPTTINYLNHQSSCKPLEHKLGGVKYLIN